MDCSKQIILAVLVLAIVYLFMNDNKESLTEYAEFDDSVDMPLPEEAQDADIIEEDEEEEVESVKEEPSVKFEETPTIIPYTEGSTNMVLSNPQETKIDLGKCGGNNGQFLSSNLLPSGKTPDEDFSEFSPANLQGKNFIDSAKFLIGTQSQSLRNANYQLRSEPPNPQDDVCAWNNTTITPDEARRVLDIGAKA